MSTSHSKSRRHSHTSKSAATHTAVRPHDPHHQHSIKNSKKWLAVLGFILLILPIYIQILWSGVSTGLAPQQRVNQFVENFPGFLQNVRLISFVSLAFCILSIICVSKSFNQPSVVLRILCIIAAIIASLIGLVNIFQML